MAATQVTGGDNELVLLKLKVEPSTLPIKKADVYSWVGIDNAVLWKARDKSGGAYGWGDDIELAVDGDALVGEVWVEGIQPHTIPQGTKLRLEYQWGSGYDYDEVALTIVGVDSVEWIGKNNSVTDDDNLDPDPNWPGNLALTPQSPVRVFPDARVVGGAVESAARDQVKVKVTLSVAPPEPINVYLRSFDLDDPTADTAPVDSEGLEQDNRDQRTWPGKDGAFAAPLLGSIDNMTEVQFAAGETEKQADFTVTLQPGDNFRVAANGDDGPFISRLKNDDSAGGTNEDLLWKLRITDPSIAGTSVQREIRAWDAYCTSPLTVWRVLHVETDSMEAVPATGPESNIVTGTALGIIGVPTIATEIDPLSVDLATGLPSGPDNSANRNSIPIGNGRFENGSITVGVGAGAATTVALGSNGNSFVQKIASSGIEVPFVLTKPGESTITGSIVAFDRAAGRFTFDSLAPAPTAGHVGGTLSVAGVDMSVSGVVPALRQVTVTAVVDIPFEMTDDDAAVLPAMPTVLPLAPTNTGLLEKSFERACVKVLFDGGGNPSNNKNAVLFRLNVDDASKRSESGGLPRNSVLA